MNWLCWHVGTHNDPKLGNVAKRCSVSKVLVIAMWAALLEHARKSDEPGSVDGLDLEDVAYALEAPHADVCKVYQEMIERDLITDKHTVSKWATYQYGSSTERVRRFRERTKQSETLHAVSETYETPTGQDKTIHNKERDSAFAEFWSVYPLKKSKGQAERAYRKAIAETEHATLVEGAKRYAADPERKPEFTKHAATWLNGKCWLDEPARNQSGSTASSVGVLISDHDSQWRARLRAYKPRGFWPSNWGNRPEEGNREIPPSVYAEWRDGTLGSAA